MHRFWTVPADASPAVLLLSVLVLYGIGRSRHKPRYTLPTGLANWHDIGPEVAALRRRSRQWRATILARRVLVAVGLYVGLVALVEWQPGRVTVGDWVRFVVAAALAAAGFALTPLCRRLADPMYSRPRGAAARREQHSLHGSLLRLGAAALYYPIFIYFFPLILILAVVGVITSVTGDYGALGGLAGLVIVTVGLLLAGGFASVVRRIDHRGLRYRSPSAQHLLAQDLRPFFLYLRTFQDDSIEIRASGTSRRGLITSLSVRRRLPFEEVIAWRFQHYGPIIAGNDPNALGLATLGAAKLFLSLDPNFEKHEGLQRWQQQIELSARNSRAVVVSAAPMALQPGVKFELEMLGSRLPSHPLVLIVPPDRRWSPRPMIKAEPTVAERWKAFTDHVEQWQVFQGIRAFNATGAAHLLVHVPGEGWSAWGAERRSEWTYAVAIKHAMNYAMERWPAAPQQVETQPLPPIQTQPQAQPQPQSPADQRAPAAPRGPRVVPSYVALSVRLMYVAMAAYVPSAFVVSNTVHAGEQSADPFIAILAFILAIPLIAWIAIARRCLSGANKARTAATVMFGFGCLLAFSTVGRVHGSASQMVTVGYLAPALGSVVLLWRRESSAYFEDDESKAAQPVTDPLSGLDADTHRLKWSQIPATVRAAVVLMWVGAAMSTAVVYIVVYRLLHSAQATPATADQSTSQLQQSVTAMAVPYVALSASVVLGTWIWAILECGRGRQRRRQRQRGRFVATACFGLGFVALLPALLSIGRDRTWFTLFILVGLAAVVLLWLPQSTPHFVKPSDPLVPATVPPTKSERPEALDVPAEPLAWARTQRVALAGVTAALFVNVMALAGSLSTTQNPHSPNPQSPHSPHSPQIAAGLTTVPCPADGASVPPPAGWSADTAITLKHGSDPAAVCLTTPAQSGSGIRLAAPANPDYTVTVKGRLTDPRGAFGWGLAVRVTVNASVEYGHNVVGHMLEYTSSAYADDEMFGSYSQRTSPMAADANWHVLSMTVQGSAYTSSVDGRQVFSGTLPLAEETAGGGVFIYTLNGATAEFETPTLIPAPPRPAR